MQFEFCYRSILLAAREYLAANPAKPPEPEVLPVVVEEVPTVPALDLEQMSVPSPLPEVIHYLFIRKRIIIVVKKIQFVPIKV